MDRPPISPHREDSMRRRSGDNSEGFPTAVVATARGHDSGDEGLGDGSRHNRTGSGVLRGHIFGGTFTETPDAGPSFVPDQRHLSRHPQQQQQQRGDNNYEQLPPSAGTTTATATVTSVVGVPTAASRSTDDSQQQKSEHEEYQNAPAAQAALFAMASTHSAGSSSSPSTEHYPYRSTARYNLHHTDAVDDLLRQHSNNIHNREPLGYDSRPNLKNDMSDRYQTEEYLLSRNKIIATANNKNNMNHLNSMNIRNPAIDINSNNTNNRDVVPNEIVNEIRNNNGDNIINYNNGVRGDVVDEYVIGPPAIIQPTQESQSYIGGVSGDHDDSTVAFFNDRNHYFGNFQDGSNPEPPQPPYASTLDPSRPYIRGTQTNEAVAAPFSDDRKPYFGKFQNDPTYAPPQSLPPYATAKQPQHIADRRRNSMEPMPSSKQSENPFFSLQDRRTYISTPSPGLQPTYASTKQQPQRTVEKRVPMLSPHQNKSPVFDPTEAMMAYEGQKHYVGDDLPDGTNLLSLQPPYASATQQSFAPERQLGQMITEKINQRFPLEQSESPFYDPTSATVGLRDKKHYIENHQNGLNKAQSHPSIARERQLGQIITEKMNQRFPLDQSESPFHDPTSATVGLRDQKHYVGNIQNGLNNEQSEPSLAREMQLGQIITEKMNQRIPLDQSESPFHDPTSAAVGLRDRKHYVGNFQNGLNNEQSEPSLAPERQQARLIMEKMNQRIPLDQSESPFHDPTSAAVGLRDRKHYVGNLQNDWNNEQSEPSLAPERQQARLIMEKMNQRIPLDRSESLFHDPTSATVGLRDRKHYAGNLRTGPDHVPSPQPLLSASTMQLERTTEMRNTRVGNLQGYHHRSYDSLISNPPATIDYSPGRKQHNDSFHSSFETSPKNEPPSHASAKPPRRIVSKRDQRPLPSAGSPPESDTKPIVPVPPTPRLSRGGLSLARSIRFRRRQNLPPPSSPTSVKAGVASPGHDSKGDPVPTAVVPVTANGHGQDHDHDQEATLATICIECAVCGGLVDNIPKNAVAVECPRCLAFFPTVTSKVVHTNT